MEQVVGFIGKGLLYLLIVIITALAVAGAQWLARRYGGVKGGRLLQCVFAAAIGGTLGNALPVLYPALAPWSMPVLGASIAFVFAAMQPGIPTGLDAGRRDAVRHDATRGAP